MEPMKPPIRREHKFVVIEAWTETELAAIKERIDLMIAQEASPHIGYYYGLPVLYLHAICSEKGSLVFRWNKRKPFPKNIPANDEIVIPVGSGVRRVLISHEKLEELHLSTDLREALRQMDSETRQEMKPLPTDATERLFQLRLINVREPDTVHMVDSVKVILLSLTPEGKDFLRTMI